ncbi:MAG: hypothetical protein WAT71_04740 [Ignavibacteria bacterium]
MTKIVNELEVLPNLFFTLNYSNFFGTPTTAGKLNPLARSASDLAQYPQSPKSTRLCGNKISDSKLSSHQQAYKNSTTDI